MFLCVALSLSSRKEAGRKEGGEGTVVERTGEVVWGKGLAGKEGEVKSPTGPKRVEDEDEDDSLDGFGGYGAPLFSRCCPTAGVFVSGFVQ